MLLKNEKIVFNLQILIIVILLSFSICSILFINNNQIRNIENHTLEPAHKTLKINNEPIDKIELRTQNSKTYDNGDGSFKSVVYVKQIHYKNNNGNWIDISVDDQVGRTRAIHQENLQPDPVNGKDSNIAYKENVIDYRDANFGSDPDLLLSYDDFLIIPSRILIYFDISSLSIPHNARIINSTFKLYYWESIDNTNTENGIDSQMTISANPLTTNWTEGTGNWSLITDDGVTWNDYNRTNSWITPGGDFDANNSTVTKTPTSYGWTLFNITKITELWLNNSIPNYGLILICDQSHGYVKKFRSSDYSNTNQRPKLEIYYQVNNPPEINNNISVFELFEDDNPKYLVLDETNDQINGIFKDPDDDDLLSFEIWTGNTWSTYSDGIPFDSINVTVELEINNSIKITPKPDKYGTDEIKIKATDNNGAWKIQNMVIKINSINDPPVLNTADKWIYLNSNASSTNGIIIKCTQGSFVNLNVTASDIDIEDLLTFNIEDFNLKNTALKDLPFQLSKSGNLNFIPSNEAVGVFTVNISVSDDSDNVWQEFIFEIENINDDPVLIKVNDVEIINHEVKLGSSSNPAAIQDQKFNITIEAIDPDIEIGISDTLIFSSFGELSDEGKLGDLKYIYSFTPRNSDAIKGFVNTNISVRDSIESEIDDWVIVNITIKNINDAPEIIKINDTFVSGITDKVLNLGTIEVNKSVETIIEGQDMDGDSLSCSANGSSIVENINETAWRIIFNPRMQDIGIVIINVTIIDSSTESQLKDWIKLKWNVIDQETSDPGNGDKNGIENHAPILKITSSQRKYKLDDKIEITGTWIEPDNDEIQILVKIQFPDGKETNYIGGFLNPLESKQDYDKNITNYQYLIIKNDGTWKFIFDTTRFKNVYENLLEISTSNMIGSELTRGTYLFTFKAIDGPGRAESEDVKIEIILEKEDTINKEEESTFNALPIIISLVIIIIIVIVFIFNIINKNKKKKTLEDLGITPKPETQLYSAPEERNEIQPTVQPQQTQQTQQTLVQPTIQKQQPQQNLCSTCGQDLTYYSKNNKYFCQQCKKYD